MPGASCSFRRLSIFGRGLSADSKKPVNHVLKLDKHPGRAIASRAFEVSSLKSQLPGKFAASRPDQRAVKLRAAATSLAARIPDAAPPSMYP